MGKFKNLKANLFFYYKIDVCLLTDNKYFDSIKKIVKSIVNDKDLSENFINTIYNKRDGGNRLSFDKLNDYLSEFLHSNSKDYIDLIKEHEELDNIIKYKFLLSIFKKYNNIICDCMYNLMFIETVYIFKAFKSLDDYCNNKPFITKLFYDHSVMKDYSSEHSSKYKPKYKEYCSVYYRYNS